MKPMHLLSIASVGLGIAWGQMDIPSHLLNQAAYGKLKKPGVGSLNVSDMHPRQPAGFALNEKTYVMGPGDILSIHLGMYASFQVDPEGNVNIPEVRPVKVGGLVLEAAKKALKTALARSYDTSKVYISLAAPNEYKIPVLGEIMNPGVKPVNSYTRVDEVISAAGGYTRYAIRNRVTLVKASGDTLIIDLARHFNEFRDEDNPGLGFGDKVLVSRMDFTKPYFVIRNGGEVFFHQIEGGERLEDVFLQINNYGLTATPTQVRLVRPGQEPRNMALDRIFDFQPQGGDTVEFKKESEVVFVGGAVIRPGIFDYTPNFSATDYLYLAGLTPQSAYAQNYTLVRQGSVVNSADLARTGVQPGDKIFIDRSNVDFTRDYLSIFASLASIVISSVALYFTVSNK